MQSPRTPRFRISGRGSGICSLYKLLHPGALENHSWGTNTATTSAVKTSRLLSIPLVEGAGVILSHLFSHQVFLHLTLCVVPHPGFISTFRRSSGGSPGVRRPDHRTERCLQSCSASVNNPVHDKEPAWHGQKALFMLLAM